MFVYGGNLGKPQGIPFLIECMQKCSCLKEAYFLVVGDGTEYGVIEDYVRRSGQQNLKLMRRLPKEDYDSMVGACDVGLIFLDHRFTIPNFPSRILSYMQAKVPVLAATDTSSDMGKMIEDARFGWWVESNDPIRVGYRDNFLPYSDFDEATGSLTGALSDFLNFAGNCEKNAHLHFEPIAFQTTEDGLQALTEGEIDCMFPVNLSAYDAEKLGIVITDPFVVTEMYALVRSADHQGISPDREMTAAVLSGHLSHETFIKDYFPKWEIRYFNSNEESFRAVAEGGADCTLVSNYRINRINELSSKYKLATLATGETMNLAVAVNREDDCLYSILNKIIRLMPDTMINASLTNYGFLDEKVTFMEFLRKYWAYLLAAVAIVAVVILLLVLHNA